MKILHLRNKLVLGVVVISVVMAVVSMLAVSVVISRQYLNQSTEQLNKASSIIKDNLNERKKDLLNASRQLAGERNLGSTIWYLGQYERSGVDLEILSSTYQELVRDTYKIGRVAQMSRIVIYDAAGKLVSFALFGNHAERVGFVTRYPAPVFQIARQKEGEELNRKSLQTVSAIPGLSRQFDGPLPVQEGVHYAIVGGALAIESYVPVMGETFNPASGKKEVRQMGLIVGVKLLDQSFVNYLASLADTRINVFDSIGFFSGDLPEYRKPDWSGWHANGPIPMFSEVGIAGARYYQSLIPLYKGKQLVGTIAALQSEVVVQKNIWEMIGILGVIVYGKFRFTPDYSVEQNFSGRCQRKTNDGR